MKSVERHQIKRDELATVLERASFWVEGNLKRVAILGGVAIALVAGALVTRSWMAGRNAEASALAGEMIEAYGAPVAASLETLQQTGGGPTFTTAAERSGKVLALADEILARHGSTSSAPRALYYKGLAQANLGRGDDASATFAEFLRRHPGDFLAPMVRFRLARLEEGRGKPAEALAHFRALADDERALFPREEGLLGVARCQEALGNREDALRTYRRIVSEYPESDYQFEARRKVDELS